MKEKLQISWKTFKKQRELQIFAWIGMAVLFVFSYLPLSGIIIAFKDYKIQMGFSGIWTADWVGIRWFKELFSYYRFSEILRNTVVLSILKLLFTFPAPIILALLLNEMKVQKFKKAVQTVTYLPNFISWILVYTIANSFLNADMGLNSGHQLRGTERLDDIIICSKTQTADLIHICLLCRYHNDRNIFVFPDFPANIKTADSRKHHIQKNQVVSIFFRKA